jgi:hypothetical protein
VVRRVGVGEVGEVVPKPQAPSLIVVLTIGDGSVLVMDVPSLDPARRLDAEVDPALQTARIAELVAELANSAPPPSGDTLTVMRDRVIWMPSVLGEFSNGKSRVLRYGPEPGEHHVFENESNDVRAG